MSVGVQVQPAALDRASWSADNGDVLLIPSAKNTIRSMDSNGETVQKKTHKVNQEIMEELNCSIEKVWKLRPPTVFFCWSDAHRWAKHGQRINSQLMNETLVDMVVA